MSHVRYLMPKKFKAIVINNQNENFSREIKELSTDELKDGNVLVKIDYSDLNYKDALILNNGGRIVKKYPFVPGIDFSGTVEESEDKKFKKGDRIILTGFRVGEIYFGGSHCSKSRIFIQKMNLMIFDE